MADVVVIGSLMTDLVARVPRMPAAGESLIGESFATFVGGKGLNQAVAAARQGAATALIGRIGSDAFGDPFLPALAADRVDARFVARDPSAGTGVACVIVDRTSGQNAIAAIPRANLALTIEQVDRALDALLEQDVSAHSSVLLAQCETAIEPVARAFSRARAAGLHTMLNAAPVPREPLSDDLLACVDTLVVNETEAEAISSVPARDLPSATAAGRRLLARGPSGVIVTLGARGMVWCVAGTGDAPVCECIPAFPASQVDATAAGDAFCGTLAARLALGDPLRIGIRWGAAAGALAVSRMGALPSLPHASETERLLRGNGQLS